MRDYLFLDITPDLLTQNLKGVKYSCLYLSEAFRGLPMIPLSGGLKFKAKKIGLGGQGSFPAFWYFLAVCP